VIYERLCQAGYKLQEEDVGIHGNPESGNHLALSH